MSEDLNLPDEKYSCPVKDKSNPRSIINICPTSMARQIAVIPDSIFAMDEAELKRAARATPLEDQLRISFWREYNSAQDNGKKINISNIYGPVCSATYFLKHIIVNSHKLAYILTPPQDYRLRLEAMLDFGLEQYEEILRLPNKDEKGNPNTKLIAEKHRIIDAIHTRVMGAVPYRIDSRNVNINSNQEIPSAANQIPLTDPKLLDAQLEELKQLAEGAIDVEPKEVSESES